MKREIIKESKKRVIIGALAGAMVFSSFGISALTADAADLTDTNKKVVLYDKDTQLAAIASKATSVKTYADYKTGAYQQVTLKGDSISFDGKGATVSGSDLLIHSAGTYVLSGTLNDGAVIIDSTDTENITIVLNNANITCKEGAPVYVKNSGKNVIISVPEGTANTITDGSNYTYENKEQTTDTEKAGVSSEPSAAIFSKDHLEINGSGKLTVNGNYKDGIASKDNLEITETTLVINAVDDGIVGKDSVVIGSGDITIKAGGDGIKSTNSEDTTKGYVTIADGTFSIVSGKDGIQAESTLLTLGGDYTIKTGEGAAAAKTAQSNMQIPQHGEGQQVQKTLASTGSAVIDTTSAKALKAGTKVVIQDGNFQINSEDDAVHSDDSVAVASGTFKISTGDDGIHADNKLDIYGGDIDIEKSYEGIESSEMNIEGGHINILSSDDGINVAGQNNSIEPVGFAADKTSTTESEAASTQKLTISGGKINVNASGDGIDVNGSGYMTGGTVAVSGPTNDGNAGLDYDGVFQVTGGTLIVAGSSGMAQAPSSGTTVNTIATAVTTQKAGTEVKLVNSSGNTILSFTPEKDFSHIVISSGVIEKGESYKIMAGSTELASFTADSIITNLSQNSGNGGMTPPEGVVNIPKGQMAPPNKETELKKTSN